MINISTARSPLVSIVTVHIIDTNTILSVDLREAQKLQKYSKTSSNCPSVDQHWTASPCYFRSDCLCLGSPTSMNNHISQLRGAILSAWSSFSHAPFKVFISFFSSFTDHTSQLRHTHIFFFPLFSSLVLISFEVKWLRKKNAFLTFSVRRVYLWGGISSVRPHWEAEKASSDPLDL